MSAFDRLSRLCGPVPSPELLADLAAAKAEVRTATLREAADVADSLRKFERQLSPSLTAAKVSENVGKLAVSAALRRMADAVDGERPENPDDNRRRIYIDSEGNGWISTCVDDGVECVVPVQPAAEVEQEITELDGLHEIGRCW